jgi:hypothetical protein
MKGEYDTFDHSILDINRHLSMPGHHYGMAFLSSIAIIMNGH